MNLMAQVMLVALSTGSDDLFRESRVTHIDMGGSMIEVNRLIWKVPRYDETFPCFVRGCHGQAGYVAKIKNGNVIVQVCLCDECLRKSPKLILQSLGIRSQRVLN